MLYSGKKGEIPVMEGKNKKITIEKSSTHTLNVKGSIWSLVGGQFFTFLKDPLSRKNEPVGEPQVLPAIKEVLGKAIR